MSETSINARPSERSSKLAKRLMTATFAVAALALPLFAAAQTANEVVIQTPAKPAAAPLILSGPVRGTAGGKSAVPIKVRAGAKFGNYVLLSNVPKWLSFSHSDNVGTGLWLFKRQELDKAEATFGSDAVGESAITVAAMNQNGSIAWQSNLSFQVSAKQQEAEKPPQPQTAAGSARAETRAPITWENVLNNNLTGPVKVEKKPAASAPARRQGPITTKSDEELAGLARNVVRECTTCHNLYGQDVGIPVMIGLTYERFMDTMYLYRTKKRDHAAMQVVAASISEEETHALAKYLGRIKPLAPGEVAEEVAAAPQPTVAIIQQAKKRDATPTMRKRIERWIQRGEEMIDNGDIAQARLLLERATEYGDSRAAFLLASSYDPNALPWRTGIGLAAEPLKARRWYAHAKSLGAGPEADQRLAQLPAPRAKQQ